MIGIADAPQWPKSHHVAPMNQPTRRTKNELQLKRLDEAVRLLRAASLALLDTEADLAQEAADVALRFATKAREQLVQKSTARGRRR